MYATKLKMKNGSRNSYDLLEIDQIYIEGCTNPGFFKKSSLYDYLEKNPNTISVKIAPYPNCIPAVSSNGEKYIKSAPDSVIFDNLLNLPRE